MRSYLTPGQINANAINIFRYGGCSALAIALYDATGWPLLAVTDAHNVHDGRAGVALLSIGECAILRGCSSISKACTPTRISSKSIRTKLTITKRPSASLLGTMPWNGMAMARSVPRYRSNWQQHT